MEPFDQMERDMREEMRRDFMLDNSLPLSVRLDYARSVDAMNYIDEFTTNPRQKMYRQHAVEQRVANQLYDEFTERLAATDNVSEWLRKRNRTPEIVFIHAGHDVGYSISFRTPTEDEPVLLAWDIRPYHSNETPRSSARELQPGQVRLETDRGLLWGQDLHGEPAPIGGAMFRSICGPIETAWDVWSREHESGTDPHEAARIARAATFTPLHRFAPTLAEVRCSCGKTRHLRWPEVLQRIERSLRPGHVRVENKRVVATLPLY